MGKRSTTQGAVGIDIVTTSRFKTVLAPRNQHLLRKLFTPKEIAYGKRYRDALPHFAGMFAAKEAASKALGTAQYPYLSLEVRHRADGAPEIWKKGKRTPVAVSISHERTAAAAIAWNV